MEKFSQWRDKGTGISPFMPEIDNANNSIGRLALVSRLIIFMVKLPFFVGSLSLLQIIPLKVIGEFICSVLFGFVRLDFSVEGIRQSKLDQINKARPDINDLVIVNYISPIDPLFVSLTAQTSFRKIVFVIPDEHGDLYEYNFRSFFYQTFTKSIGTGRRSHKLKDLSKLSGKLIFLFIEGTPSNNRGVLPFIPFEATIPSFFHIKAMALKVQPISLTLPIPTVSPWRYIYSLLSNMKKPSVVKAKLYEYERFDPVQVRKAFQLSQLNLIGEELDIHQKQKFLKYYIENNKKK